MGDGRRAQWAAAVIDVAILEEANLSFKNPDDVHLPFRCQMAFWQNLPSQKLAHRA